MFASPRPLSTMRAPPRPRGQRARCGCEHSVAIASTGSVTANLSLSCLQPPLFMNRALKQSCPKPLDAFVPILALGALGCNLQSDIGPPPYQTEAVGLTLLWNTQIPLRAIVGAEVLSSDSIILWDDKRAVLITPLGLAEEAGTDPPLVGVYQAHDGGSIKGYRHFRRPNPVVFGSSRRFVPRR